MSRPVAASRLLAATAAVVDTDGEGAALRQPACAERLNESAWRVLVDRLGGFRHGGGAMLLERLGPNTAVVPPSGTARSRGWVTAVQLGSGRLKPLDREGSSRDVGTRV